MQEQQKAQESSQGHSSSDSQILALLSYLGILALVPYFMKPADEFAAFHAKQGIRLLVAEVLTALGAMVLGSMLRFVPMFWLLFGWALNLLWLFWVVLSIMGIVNVLQKKKAPLPVIGKM